MTPLIAIPARYGSSRLPGKPLRLLAGRPLIAHVVDRARACWGARVVVATDDPRILQAVHGLGVEAVLTRSDHPTGTDRLAEVAELLQLPDAQVVVNLQGDEPLMPLSCLQAVMAALQGDPEAAVATLAWPIADIDEWFDPNVVKVVCDQRSRALYFSRAPIPWARDALAIRRDRLPEGAPPLRHVGLYAYRAGALRQLAALPPTDLEQAESLEQLRALGHGLPIVVAAAPERIPGGVDTEADLRRVEAELQAVAATPVAETAWRGPPVQSVLFVCMGNLCRSPLSLAYAQRLAASLPWAARLRLASRGTHEHTRGASADLRTAMLARAKGLDLGGHRATPVELADLQGFDLIIAHDERNLADLRRICPPQHQHKLRLLLEFAAHSGHTEVPDPYHGDHSDFILADELIRQGVEGLFAELQAGPRPHRPSRRESA